MEQNTHDVIITVIASRGRIYDQFIEEFWVKFIRFVKNIYPSVHIIIIFGKDETTTGLTLNDENIFYGTKPDSIIPGIYDKTLECFEHIEASYHYKYIFRANLSTFLIIDELLKCSQSLPESNVYAGVIGKIRKGLKITFCSGAGFWMSPDIVKQLICNQNNIDRNKYNDDVVISIVLKDVPRTNMPRFNLNKNIKDKSICLRDIIQKGMYQIRIKNSKNRQLDIDYVKYFTNTLYSTN